MGNMIDTGLAYFTTAAAQWLSSPILYTRGTDSVTLDAIIDDPKQLDFSILGQTPGLIDMNQVNPIDLDQPFNFEAAKLILNIAVDVPLSGDKITATIGGIAGIYEVLSPMGGGLPWEWLNNRTRIRVHTKFLRLVD